MDLLPEIEVWYGLPAIRRKLVLAMKSKSKSQREIAKILGIAESAVSQYVSGKRGHTTLPPELDHEFERSAQLILDGDSTSASETMRLSTILKNKRILCDIHKSQDSTLPNSCDHCFVDE